MLKVWVLLVFWTPVDGFVADMSIITTGKKAYLSYDECQQARAEVMATLAADNRPSLSRCDELAIERTKPFRP